MRDAYSCSKSLLMLPRSLCLGVLKDFNSLRSTKQSKNIATWSPIVAEVLQGCSTLDDADVSASPCSKVVTQLSRSSFCIFPHCIPLPPRCWPVMCRRMFAKRCEVCMSESALLKVSLWQTLLHSSYTHTRSRYSYYVVKCLTVFS